MYIHFILLPCRYLQLESGCSLTVRDGVAERTARDWLEQTCDIPQYMDPFGRNADISAISAKKPRVYEPGVDDSQVRVFLFMKDKPNDTRNDEISLGETYIKPPWDISTNIETPPKYLKSGQLNPARCRPSSAAGYSCNHYKGGQTVRPFSAPCGYPEFTSWKHPIDIKPYLNVDEMSNYRRYQSITDLSEAEEAFPQGKNNSRLLSARSLKGWTAVSKKCSAPSIFLFFPILSLYNTVTQHFSITCSHVVSFHSFIFMNSLWIKLGAILYYQRCKLRVMTIILARGIALFCIVRCLSI